MSRRPRPLPATVPGLALAGLLCLFAPDLEAQVSGVLQARVRVVSAAPELQISEVVLRRALTSGTAGRFSHPAETAAQVEVSVRPDSTLASRRVRLTIAYLR